MFDSALDEMFGPTRPLLLVPVVLSAVAATLAVIGYVLKSIWPNLEAHHAFIGAVLLFFLLTAVPYAVCQKTSNRGRC